MKLNPATGLDHGMEVWLILTARKHYWRVAHWMEPEDLIQDGYMIWAHCRQRYPSIESRAHFMSIVRTSFFRYITDLSRSRTLSREFVPELPVTLAEESWMKMLVDLSDSEFTLMVRQSIFPIKAVFDLFTSHRGLALLRSFPQRKHEQFNSYLCRLIGVDARQYDLPQLVKDYLIPIS